MKRVLILLIAVVLACPVFALAEDLGNELELLKDEPKTVNINTKWLDERAKLGLAIGEPWGLV